MPDTLADSPFEATSSRPEAGAPSGAASDEGMSTANAALAEERRLAFRRFDLKTQWTMLIVSSVIVFLAIVLSVPGSAREEEVIVPILNRALPPLCSSKVLFDRECPGCGMTRCFISMAHGDVARAWRFNPVGIYFFLLVVAQIPYRAWQLSRLYRGKETLRDARLYVFLYLLMALMLVQFVAFSLFGR